MATETLHAVLGGARDYCEAASVAVEKARGICMLMSECTSIPDEVSAAANAAYELLCEAEEALKQQWVSIGGRSGVEGVNHG